MLDQWPLRLWTLCRHSWNIMETSCPIICISNQIPSIYITVKAVRHLAGTPNLFDFATYRLCATSTCSWWVVSVREAMNYVFLKREDDDWNGWALMKMLMLSGLCSNRRKWCWGSSPRPPLTIKLDTQRVLQTRCQKRHPILSLFYSTWTSSPRSTFTSISTYLPSHANEERHQELVTYTPALFSIFIFFSPISMHPFAVCSFLFVFSTFACSHPLHLALFVSKHTP